MSIKSTVVTDNRINANVSPPTKIVPKNVLIPDVSKELIGLGNVDNTADIDKPISTLVQAALDLKANQSTTYTKTEVDAKLTATGNDASSDLTAHVDSTNNPHSVTAAQIGLGNVEDKSAATIIGEIVDSDIPSTIARNSELSAHTSLTNNPHSVTATQVNLGNVTNESKATMFTGAVFTGDLTSDTDTLFVDSTNHRVGIGTTSPNRALHIKTSTTDDDGQHPLRIEGASSSIIEINAGNDTSFSGIDFGDTTIESGNASSHPGSIIYNHSNDSMIFDTNNATRMTIDSSGKIGINKMPGRTLDMDGHFRLEVTRPNRTTESVAVIKSNDQTAADLRVDGPIRVTHDLFKESGVTGGFADNSNHFHTIQTINRITQQGTGEVKNIERVQEQYYAIQSNNLKNDKAAFWNWHRVSRSIDITAVSLTNLEGWNVSAIQDSNNRENDQQKFFKDSENTIFTFNSQVNREAVLSNGDLLQVNIDIDFEGAIVAASLFAKVTGVSGATANVKLYGGNYKSTTEVADGNDQTALTTNFSVNKINTGSYMALAGGTGVDALLDSTRTTTTDTFSLTFASNHNLELNDTITLITDSTNGFKAAEVAFVKEKTSNTQAKFVYGRVFEPASNLVLGDLASSSVIGVLKGSIDPLHDFTAGDQLMHFNADNAGRYKSYQIGPGSEVGADCISIGKNVYNKDASTIKIGYDNNMLNIHSTGIDVEGKIKTTGIINGSTHATAQPITYDAKEHRFRDFDTNPNNLMVIKKTDGVPIGKVGINHNNPVSALHVVGGHTSSGVGAPNEALRVVGSGLFTSVDDIALIVARDTDNNDSHSSGNDLGGHVLKIKQDFSDPNSSDPGVIEEMNIGFVGSGGDGIYTNSQPNAAYLHVANGRNFEIATGSGNTPARRLSINGTSGTVVVSGALSVGSSATVGGDLKVNDKIIHNGDTDTAIRFPGNNIFTVETAGVERLRVNSTGEVGIGKTAATGVELDVNGDIAATNITANGNVAITGNLTISGTTTTINTTNLDITDNIIGLNNGLTGTNLNDSGIIIERGTSGANAAIIWDESGGKFVLGTTATATANSTGNIIVTEGNLKINDLEASGDIAASGNLAVSGTLTIDSTSTFDSTMSVNDDIDFVGGGSITGVADITANGNIIASGKVGIGATTSPTYSLDLNESSGDNTIRLVSKNNGTAIRIGAGGSSSDVTLLRVDGASNANNGNSDSSNFGFSMRYIGSGNGNANAFRIEADNQAATTRVTALTILQDGKVGIGTTTASEALEVAGNISFDGDLHISSDGYISWNGGSDNVISVEERFLIQPDGNEALTWSDDGVYVDQLEVGDTLTMTGDLEMDGTEINPSGNTVTFGGGAEFGDDVDLGGQALTSVNTINNVVNFSLSGAAGLFVDTNVLAVNSSLNKIGINTTPVTQSPATLNIEGSVAVEESSEKHLELNTLTSPYNYKIGDIDGGESGAHLHINSVDEYARLHTNLGIGKDPGSGKALDVSGDVLFNNLEVEATMLVSGDFTSQTTMELSDGAGIEATGDIETTGIVKAKGYALDTNTFTVVSTTSTLASSTNGLTVILQNTGPITITLPTLTAGHVTTFISETIHGVSFVGDTGVTVNSFNGANTTAGQFAQCQVIYKTSTTAFLGGNIV